jgi:hypothetical protein
MQVHIFRGDNRVFAFTGDESGGNLPPALGDWTPFKSLELERGQQQPGVDVDECLDDLERYGLHVTDAHVRITEQVIG